MASGDPSFRLIHTRAPTCIRNSIRGLALGCVITELPLLLQTKIGKDFFSNLTKFVKKTMLRHIWSLFVSLRRNVEYKRGRRDWSHKGHREGQELDDKQNMLSPHQVGVENTLGQVHYVRWSGRNCHLTGVVTIPQTAILDGYFAVFRVRELTLIKT